jgi:hypothetical protein
MEGFSAFSQLLQNVGVVGILGMLVWWLRGWVAQGFSLRRATLEHHARQHAATLAYQASERELDRKSRHDVANNYQQSLAHLVEFFTQRSEAQAASFDKRNDQIVTAIRDQTATLKAAMDDVKKAVVDNGH